MESIYLKSTEPTKNRDRFYTIKIDETHGNCFKVFQGWGRGSQIQQSRTTEFGLKKEALRYTRSLLKRRKKNGYSINFISVNFPECELTSTFPKSNQNPFLQLSLFETIAGIG